MGAGCAILLVVCLLYGGARYKEWLALQPRRAQTNQVIGIATPKLTPTPTLQPTPTPTPTPVALPPVRIEIPRIGVSRSVVPVELVSDPTTGELVWDVESLFATTGRSDLVGHLEDSVYPGMNGNIVLTGHNYNRGRYNWTAVFYDLGQLKIGDQITLTNAQDSQFIYVVEQIASVPWRSKSEEELSQHMAFLGDTSEETLTLVTCGGANIWPFPDRLYVVAKPAQQIAQ
jgi:LPXTG-site transpeptidase (sortase) family protein